MGNLRRHFRLFRRGWYGNRSRYFRRFKERFRCV